MPRLSRVLAVALAASASLTLGPSRAEAQNTLSDRLIIHGSVNIGYGRTDSLPYFGFRKDGTSEQRAVALQVGWRIDDNDRVVTQFLHRRTGESPLNDIEPDFFPVWAFYEHTFDNGATVKLGRNPLPRGIFNEVRFVGTLLPFYRVGATVYGETLEFIDGVVAGKRWDAGDDWSIETYGFAGGFNIKAQLPGAEENEVIDTRTENTFGAQVWLNTPIDGVRIGAFANSYEALPEDKLADPAGRTLTTLFSAEAVRSFGFARAEYTSFQQDEPDAYTNYTAWYAQLGVKPTPKVTVAAEYSTANNEIRFAGTPIPNLDIPITKELGVGVTYAPSPQIALKLEARQNEGYSYDVPVPSVIPPTAPPLVARLADPSKVTFWIASVAVAF
jgi:hypothetical protein